LRGKGDAALSARLESSIGSEQIFSSRSGARAGSLLAQVAFEGSPGRPEKNPRPLTASDGRFCAARLGTVRQEQSRRRMSNEEAYQRRQACSRGLKAD